MASKEQPVEDNKEREPEHVDDPSKAAIPPADVPEEPVDEDEDELEVLRPRGKATSSVGGR
ncbi:hypothetical protein BOTBODRAFT_170057 [Botryobasidium botryosum FD-172 SS1]|uniref:Uncharacterized protein n=1 Tax=Botryobasidium botryosum (strain FD-172 SS1) TaxID=930990 RepID=A0A067MZ92_BOTB1|nr:hypothetical protein BOTBODRAFT_170057 [Botryobasidium botryosum FD-172 SS1]